MPLFQRAASTPWTCSCCGKIHDSLPNSFAFDKPAYWSDRSPSDASPERWLDPDYCIADGHHFIRATLEIPVHESGELFVFGIWSTLSLINFDRERALALDPKRIEEPPYFGWFSNRIWQYPDTLNLKCNILSQKPGRRPLIELEPTDHPLAVEQRNGISYARFLELSAQCMHRWKHPGSGIE